MIDTWEIFGRIAADDGFRNAVFTGSFKPPYGIGVNMRASIPGGDYDTARRIIQPYIPGRPLSLMALGEVLWALTFQKFKRSVGALSDNLKATGVVLTARDFLFYVALGAMIIDDQLRLELQQNPANFDAWGFNSVPPGDRTDLGRIFNPALPAGQKVIASANDVCDSVWEPGCNDKLVFWGGHTHPVANP